MAPRKRADSLSASPSPPPRSRSRKRLNSLTHRRRPPSESDPSTEEDDGGSTGTSDGEEDDRGRGGSYPDDRRGYSPPPPRSRGRRSRSPPPRYDPRYDPPPPRRSRDYGRSRGYGPDPRDRGRDSESTGSSGDDENDPDDGSDSEDDEKNLVGGYGGPRSRSRSSRPLPPGAVKSSQRKDPTRKYIIWLGVTVIVCLAALGIVAIVKYVGNGSAAASAGNVTVTVTAAGGQLSTQIIAATTTAGTTKAPVATAGSTGTTTPTGNSTSSSSSSASGGASTFPGISKNGIGIGFVPDYGENGGPAQTIVKLNEALGIKSSFLGWYAQLPETGDWTGSQITGSVLEDAKASGAIFQPAVMANKNNWNGLTPADNYQALAIAKVLKEFTDEGIEVWLRFAHELNWYQSPDDPDKTYSGTVDDFKTAWATVAAAVKDDPLIKMFFTPNIGDMTAYEKYYPDDPSTVDIIGIDYYPKAGESFLDHMQDFYDAHCKDGSTLFAIGETGLSYTGTMDEKLAWWDQLTSAETAKAMPNYVGISWFNYMKGVDFEVYGEDDDGGRNEIMKAWLADGTVASGAKMGNA